MQQVLAQPMRTIDPRTLPGDHPEVNSPYKKEPVIKDPGQPIDPISLSGDHPEIKSPYKKEPQIITPSDFPMENKNKDFELEPAKVYQNPKPEPKRLLVAAAGGAVPPPGGGDDDPSIYNDNSKNFDGVDNKIAQFPMLNDINTKLNISNAINTYSNNMNNNYQK